MIETGVEHHFKPKAHKRQRQDRVEQDLDVAYENSRHGGDDWGNHPKTGEGSNVGIGRRVSRQEKRRGGGGSRNWINRILGNVD